MDKNAPYRSTRAVRWVGVLATAIVVGVVGAVGVTGAAYANFPHFKTFSVTTTTSLTGVTAADDAAATVASAELPDLLYRWTEVGLGKPDVTYRLQSVVSATFGCVNLGSNQPRAGNKTTVTVPVATAATLTADKNGSISGAVVLDTAAVSPGSFSCPSGQSLVALSATFAQNTITDTTNGVTATDDDIVVILWP